MRRAALGLALSIALVASSARAQTSNPVYPPGLEDRIAALAFRGDGPALTPTLEVGGARVEADRVEVSLARGEQPVGRVWLTHPSARMEAERIGQTASFAVWLADGSGQPGVREAADALVARIAARDDGSLGEAPARAAPDPVGRRASSPFGSILRAVAWLALLLICGLLASRDREALWPTSRRERLALLALVALALALRLALPAWSPLHANDHGIGELRGLSGLEADAHEHEASLYGPAYLELVRAVLAPFGIAPDAVLALGALFGALAVLLIHRVAAQLVTDPSGPFLAALGLALYPSHVRLSLSESPRALSGALLLLGILLGLRARERAPDAVRAAAIVGAALAWALAAELRVITGMIPIAGLAVVLLAAPRARLASPRDAIAAAVGLGVVGAFLALHADVLLEAAQAGAERPPIEWSRRLGVDNILFDPLLSPIVLAPLGLVGLAAFWRGGQRRTALGLALGVALLLPPSLLICACRTDAIRYQSEASFFLLLALAGFSAAGFSLARRGRAWLALPIALGAASIPGLVALTQPDLEEQATAIVRASAPPPPTVIVAPPREMEGDRAVRAVFPDYLIASPERARTTLPEPPDERSGCVVYVGPPCWSFGRQGPRHGVYVPSARGLLREECAALLGGPEAARAAVDALPTASVPWREREFHHVDAERPRLGFAPCPPR